VDLSCASICTCAEELAASAQAAATTMTRQRRAELTTLVERHLQEAERRLPAVARRALLRDHRRCAQLMRAIELALDDTDLVSAAASARALARFIVAHEQRERAYLD
jgi:hypothetical protein